MNETKTLSSHTCRICNATKKPGTIMKVFSISNEENFSHEYECLNCIKGNPNSYGTFRQREDGVNLVDLGDWSRKK